MAGFRVGCVFRVGSWGVPECRSVRRAGSAGEACCVVRGFCLWFWVLGALVLILTLAVSPLLFFTVSFFFTGFVSCSYSVGVLSWLLCVLCCLLWVALLMVLVLCCE